MSARGQGSLQRHQAKYADKLRAKHGRDPEWWRHDEAGGESTRWIVLVRDHLEGDVGLICNHLTVVHRVPEDVLEQVSFRIIYELHTILHDGSYDRWDAKPDREARGAA